MKTIIAIVLLFSSTVLAQSLKAGGGGADACTGKDCTVKSLTTSASAADGASTVVTSTDSGGKTYLQSLGSAHPSGWGNTGRIFTD